MRSPSSLIPGGPQGQFFRVNHPFWLACTYCTWGILVAVSVGLFILSLPAGHSTLQQTCTSSTCLLPWQLSPAEHHLLEHMGLSIDFYAIYILILAIVLALGYVVMGLLIGWHHRHSGWGMVGALALITWGTISEFADQLTALHPTWIGAITLVSFVSVSCTWIFLYGFPDGQFVPRWMRWLVITWIVLEFGYAFLPYSPFSQRTWPDWLAGITWVGAWVIGIATQIYRYARQTTPLQRPQTKWVVCGFAGSLLGLMVASWVGTLVGQNSASPEIVLLSLLGGPFLGMVALLLPPLCLGIAIVRYRLWDIDIIINRTLVYGTLTASVVGLYVLIVGGLGTVLEVQGNVVLALLATGLIAVLFQPLHLRLQRAINRLMFGERDDPYRILSRLGQRLEETLTPEAILPTIVETVTQALKLPYAAINLKQGESFILAAAQGIVQSEVIHLPLVYQAEQVGEFVLAPRAPGEPFASADRQLLEDLARQAGVAAHAVRLTADLKRLATDLQRSRERLVTAREEERRRLRRDLHDGLGPQLASLTLKLETARNRLAHDPLADTLLVDLTTRTQTAVSDIRRLVYALRPPALDELGLVAALREQALQFNDQRPSGLRLTCDLPERLPPLPAAVEVAAYRIVQEALTNVVRHAQARRCTLCLALEATHGTVLVDVVDDGQGWVPGRKQGVGLSSMRERAEELGGTLTVESLPTGGLAVRASLPYTLSPPTVTPSGTLPLQEV